MKAFSWVAGRKGAGCPQRSVWNGDSCGKDCGISTQNQC